MIATLLPVIAPLAAATIGYFVATAIVAVLDVLGGVYSEARAARGQDEVLALIASPKPAKIGDDLAMERLYEAARRIPAPEQYPLRLRIDAATIGGRGR